MFRLPFTTNAASRAALRQGPWSAQGARRCMSVRPQELSSLTPPPRKKVTIQTLHSMRKANKPITMVTAYDYPTGQAASSSPLIDMILVGDSLSQVCLGFGSTTQLTLEAMIHHASAVARGATHPFRVVDMPFGSYHVSAEETIRNATRLVREGGAEAVKMEGGKELAEIVHRLTELGIPVMAHIGLTPQRQSALSGFKVQGKSVEGASKVLSDALALQDAGAFAMVVEAVPRELGKHITDKVKVPTIGIGAGPGTSGQVIVLEDLVGTWDGHKPKFVRRFANVKEVRDIGIHKFGEAVRGGSFPHPEEESYTMDPQLWQQFMQSQGDNNLALSV
ncbi:ketopantoate hydroxymethyltransferase [Coprinopsis cinerea okayama7|uniref:3-methyl-2-oxobutanoate hydroxymethyltransferase n=1 Tax=Coprinopsis cinerea (strain Okayama-7 / 130 / ATCC MYA-4618 / FGSC 9003) TaxID=240176 RepID=A8NR68_COPC7|nr:ketopantoate hydroxymethyltransferase [Coprinopsis cinerea okayama7\|eukprot:XP_001835711.1 ketopantoate hydroxymethyltransferase [Coprinopsis cinerea okayama7\